MEKKEKLVLFLYGVFIFGFTYIFYTQVKPIMVCDPDDWTYISSIRYAIPIWKDWNPSKVFPETLMGLCGFFAAYAIYPIIGDYIMSFTYVYAFIVTLFIVFYIIAILLFVKKALSMTMHSSLVCSFIAYLLHFLFMLHRGTDNLFMLTACNLNCFLNYTIPVLFCLMLALHFIQKYLFSKNSLLLNENLNCERLYDQHNYYKTGVVAFLIYLSIFSNMVCNIILIGPFIYMFVSILGGQIKAYGVKKVFKVSNIKRYALFIYTFLLELICLIFEYNGGRAKSLTFNTESAIRDIVTDLKYIWVNINKKIAAVCIIVICSAIFVYAQRKRKGLAVEADERYEKSIRIMLFSFVLSFVYIILLYVRIGQHKLQRSENIFVIYIFLGSAIAISIGYILALFRKIWICVPLVLYVMTTTTIFGNYKQSISYYGGNTELCYLVNNNIIEQYKQAECMGLKEFELHVPAGLGSYDFTADRISRTLYKHGIINKRIQANMVIEPIDYFYK